MQKEEFAAKVLSSPDGVASLKDGFVFLRKINILKDGDDTRVFCAETGREVVHEKKLKVDYSSGKQSMAMLQMEVEVVEVVYAERQIDMFSESEPVAPDAPGGKVLDMIPAKASR